MSQKPTLEVSDEVYEVYTVLQQKVKAVELSISQWIVATLSEQDIAADEVGIDLSETQEQARQRFRSHAGAVSLGYATGVDNDSIDADLARAYANEY